MGTSYLRTREFWAGALERAVRAAAWTIAAVLGVPNAGEAVGVDVLHVGWRDAATLALGAAVASLVASIVAGKVAGPGGSPSLVDDRPNTLR
ncbi:holin [Micromonospora sp. DT47]|uniref:holin n=1 Tax=Micromonospora sp. DT47 TaxID=3393431 RepID=UPI003CE8F9D7